MRADGKILATRGEKKATPPCTSRRQDGIIVPRLPCPPLAADLLAGSG